MWFLDHSEGKLNDHDKELLSDFLDSNPDLKEEFESFEIFELNKSDLVFTGKTSLKKQINIENIEGLDEFEMLAIKKIEGNISENELDVLRSSHCQF